MTDIRCIDCREGIKELPDNSIDMIITSPPYNVQGAIQYNEYSDDLSKEEYDKLIYQVFSNAWNKLKNDGRVAINVPDYKGGTIPVHYYIMRVMESIGYKFYTTIVWNKNTVNSRTAWGSFQSASNPSLILPFEYILVFYKESKGKLSKGVSTISSKEFTDWSLGLWTFTPEVNMNSKFKHPAMFPEELPYRLIQMFTYKGDLVVDPFNGIGTTGVVCKKTERDYIGFDIDKLYVDKSIERIQNTRIQKKWVKE